MKHNLNLKLLILIIMIAGIMFINTDTYALSCAESESDSILDHIGVDSSYDINSRTVSITVKNGSFIVTHVEGEGIITGDNAPIKNTASYEGVNYDYYLFGTTKVVNKKSPLKFNVKRGGVIKIGLSFFKEDEKNKKDAYTGCYSYDYWLKNGGNNSSIRTFETKKVENGKTQYIEIDVPNSATPELKTNTNKNTYCKAITEGVNYNNKFDKNVMKYWSNDIRAIEFYKNIIGDCWEDQVVFVYSEKDIINLIESTIKLWHNNSFNYDTGLGKDEVWSINFENVKKAAIAAGHAYYAEDSSKGATFYKLVNDGKGAKVNNTSFSLQCKYDGNNLDYRTYDSAGNVVYKDGKLVYNIGANVQNFYAKTYNSQYVTYTYNYTGSSSYQNKVTEKVEACRAECEEAVEVKYGPPVASKAGLCFEYQVQVTSRVKCKTVYNLEGQPRKSDFCSPVPYCNRIPGYIHQAGPSEEYDSCINECDGGKYSKSCSDKCYNKVYGNTTGASKTAVDTIASDVLEKLSANGSEKFVQPNNGVYIRNKSNTIYWRKNAKGENAVGYARYYLEGSERARTLRDHGAYFYDSNGFKRAKYGDTYCHDACRYDGCGKNTYLNPGEMEKDYARNMELYNQAIANCKLAASCTEKTATFKISTNYKENVDGKVVTKTVDYNDSTLDSDDDKACSNENVPTTGNILLDYQGCYKKCGVGQQYHARWSFPGTWFNIKTGEISYKSKPTESWYEEDDKFCTPKAAQNVNESWWNYYLHNNEKTLKKFNIDADEYSNKCSSGHGTIKNPLSVDKINPEWNIFASTKNFGYFGWNFDIKCFYALNQCGDATYTNYRVRSVDNSNMFPDESGSTLTDYAETGRETGFNWSSDSATNKNPGYQINPPAYIASIQRQSAGSSIYTDANLDYEFNLTSKDIKELRKVRNYTDFSEGSYMKPGTGANDAQNGVARYYSDVISNYASRRPGKKAVQCNNIKDSSSNSGECDNYNAG